MGEKRQLILPAVLVAAGALTVGLFLLAAERSEPSALEPSFDAENAATATPEPTLPTRTPAGDPAAAVAGLDQPPEPDHLASLALEQPAVGSRLALTESIGSPSSSSTAIPLLSRFGLSGRLDDVGPAMAAGLRFGSFYNWKIYSATIDLPGVTFWQTLRVSESGFDDSWDDIAAAAAANPGSVWMIGNEPDVIWQDNVTPDRYAALYHRAYTFLKAQDPTSQIAIGAVSMPTPLRRAYLDRVLEAYRSRFNQPMPIDLWNIHAYILREEAGSWGVDIPPGMDGESELGRLYEIEDHDDIQIFKQNILEFREWMDASGYGGYPLAVTEFGVLMPADYGFPPEANGRFMRAAVHFMLTKTGDTGFPADDGRLVQWWFWYSVVDPVGPYASGDLYDPTADQLTYLGRTWSSLAQGQ